MDNTARVDSVVYGILKRYEMKLTEIITIVSLSVVHFRSTPSGLF